MDMVVEGTGMELGVGLGVMLGAGTGTGAGTIASSLRPKFDAASAKSPFKVRVLMATQLPE